MKKMLFYNISGAIHSNNISEILILFEYFRNLYPSHRRLMYIMLNWKLQPETQKKQKTKQNIFFISTSSFNSINAKKL